MARQVALGESHGLVICRSLATRLGVIENLRVPHSRDGTYRSQILSSHARRAPDVKDIDELLSFLAEPLVLAPKLRTTNAIEQALRDIRRRTNPMSCCKNDASCEGIIYGVFQHQNDVWRQRPLTDWPWGC